MRQFKRADRIRSQILRDVQKMLAEECTLNLKALVTFTDVEISNDLKYATIYYSVLGQDEAKNEASKYLSRIMHRVQMQIGRLLRIKNVPEIKFKFDPSIERGMRIEQLLNEISKENEQRKTDDI
jgi:ribosome-binding factor A